MRHKVVQHSLEQTTHPKKKQEGREPLKCIEDDEQLVKKGKER